MTKFTNFPPKRIIKFCMDCPRQIDLIHILSHCLTENFEIFYPRHTGEFRFFATICKCRDIFKRPTNKFHDYFPWIRGTNLVIFFNNRLKNLWIFPWKPTDEFLAFYHTIDWQFSLFTGWWITRYFPRDKITKFVIYFPRLNDEIYDFSPRLSNSSF